METTKAGVLGSGSYGTVCVATHRKTGQQFACKQLKLNRATPRWAQGELFKTLHWFFERRRGSELSPLEMG
jgi:serine/threonine protein kinase